MTTSTTFKCVKTGEGEYDYRGHRIYKGDCGKWYCVGLRRTCTLKQMRQIVDKLISPQFSNAKGLN